MDKGKGGKGRVPRPHMGQSDGATNLEVQVHHFTTEESRLHILNIYNLNK